MIFAVDTNILLDTLIPNTAHVQSSLNCLMSIAPNDELIICEHDHLPCLRKKSESHLPFLQ